MIQKCYFFTISQESKENSLTPKFNHPEKNKQFPILTFLPQCLIIVRLFFFLFFVPVKEGNKVTTVWCYQSEGLTKFNHLEVVVLLEIRKKEEIFPEEVLRVYRGILHLASKLGEYFTARIHLMTLS